MATYVIRPQDLVPAYTDNAPTSLSHHFDVERHTDAGGSRTFQICHPERVRAHFERMGLDTREVSLPFPPRCRWTREQGEQMIALVPVARPIMEAPALQPESDMRRSWSRSNPGYEMNFIDGQGQAVPAQNPDVLTVVIHGVPESQTPTRASEEEAFQPYSHHHYYNRSRVFALPALEDPNADEDMARLGLSRVGNTVYVRLGLRVATVSANTYLQAVVGSLSINEDCLSEERQRAMLEAKRARAMERLYHRLGLTSTAGQQQNLAASEGQARNARQRIQAAQQEIDRILERQKETVDESMVYARAQEQLLMLQSMDKVADLSFTRSHLVVTTTDLCITNGDETYKAGRYRIEFALDSMDTFPEVSNLTRRVRGTHHPHIQSHTCWGSLKEPLRSLQQQREFPAMVIMIIAYLEACNDDDVWGRSVTNWPKV